MNFQQTPSATRSTWGRCFLFVPAPPLWVIALLLVLAVGFFPFGATLHAQGEAPEADSTPLSPQEIQQYQQEAEAGDAAAQAAWGMILYLGRGGEVDHEEAAKWLQRAAEQGNADAQNMMGNLHFSGQGVPRADDGQALKWYRMAADQGHPEAQVNLGLMYYMGLGVEADEARSVNLFRQAAEQGHRGAQRHMGVLYSKGEGVPLDRVEARRWLLLAEGRSPDEEPGTSGSEGGASASAGVALGAADPLRSLLALVPPERAAEEVSQGQAALAGGDIAAALTHFRTAATQVPESEELVRAAAMLSLRQGETGPALALFRKAAALAVKDAAYRRIATYNRRISELAAAMPDWAEQKVEQVSAPPEGEGVDALVNEWHGLRAQADQLSRAGRESDALAAAGKAWELSRTRFGSHHYMTHLSLRGLATHLFRSGQPGKADPLLRQSLAGVTALLGERHPETLAIVSELGEVREQALDYSEARKLYERARAGYAEGLGPGHPSTLRAGRFLARILRNVGADAAGQSQLEQVCAQAEESLGRFHPDTADCLRQRAALFVQTGDYPQAEKLYDQALEIRLAIAPPQDPATLKVQMEKAGLLRFLARFEAAETLIGRTIAALEAAGEAQESLLFKARFTLAQILETRGHYERAERLMQQVLAHERAALGPDHPDAIATLTSLANLRQRRGDLEEAEEAFKEALGRSQQVLGGRHPTTIALLNNLGLAFQEEGLYDRAEPMFKGALDAAREILGETHPTTMATMNSLALLHQSQGQFDRAAPMLESLIGLATARLGAEHPDATAFINNLAYLRMMSEEFEPAGEAFERAVALWTRSLGKRNQTTLKGMNNLARVRMAQGRLDEAEALFEETLGLRREVMGPRHMDTIRTLHDLSVLRQRQGRLQESDALFGQTLKLCDTALGPRHPYTFETLNDWASLKEAMNDLEQAHRLRADGFQRRNVFLNQMMWVTGDNAREGYARLHRPEFNDYLSLLSRLDPEVGGREVLTASLFRKGLLLQISSQINQIARLSDNPELEEMTEELNQARKRLAALTLSGPTEESGEAHLRRLHDLEDRISEIEGELGRASRRFQESTAAVTLESLIANLPESAVLVDFLVFEEEGRSKLLAGLLTHDDGEPRFGMVVYEDLEAIQKLVIEYRTVIQDEDAVDDDFLEVGNIVYDALWGPLEPFIGDRVDLYIAPDGILNILPFNALVNNDEDYLIQVLDLHILTSSRDLLPSALPRARGPYITLAGPNYDESQAVDEAEIYAARARSASRVARAEVLEAAPEGEQATPEGRRSATLRQLRQGLRAFSSGMRGLKFDPLPGAQKEGELINAHVEETGGASRLFTLNEAQERVIKSLGAPPEILHIATHGFFLQADDNLRRRLLSLQRGAEIHLPPPGDNPLLRSGLAFAGVNANAPLLGEVDTDNDGVLTALEVLGLDLSGTRLAVLSACETGLGQIHEGEGVYGLRRSFQEAGVEQVIASLWEVSDAGTQALMTGLYQRLVEGMDPREALRESQRELFQSPRWGYPYIWAAFMIVGK